jgi:chemotaxis response regulator CheB
MPLANGPLLMKQSIRIRERARVGLINDSSDILEGLEASLSKSHRVLVVGTARTEDEAVAFLRACQPDVVVLDVRVGRVSGIKLCEVIRESYPKTAVLFFGVILKFVELG